MDNIFKEQQIICINDEEYSIENMIEYDDGEIAWQEYELKGRTVANRKWLYIYEGDGLEYDYFLYQEYNAPINTNEKDTYVNGEWFELHKEGNAKIRRNFGYFTSSKENYKYYNYLSKDFSRNVIVKEVVNFRYNEDNTYNQYEEEYKISSYSGTRIDKNSIVTSGKIDEKRKKKNDEIKEKQEMVAFIAKIFIAIYCFFKIVEFVYKMSGNF